MARKSGRTARCSNADARRRLADARQFIAAGETFVDGDEIAEDRGRAVVSLAVLAGIAASDAACCHALGEHSRSQAHSDAIDLLEHVDGGEQAAKQLRRLLALKDAANYGLGTISSSKAKSAVRSAAAMVTFAEETLRT